MDMGRALQQQDQRSRGLKRRYKPAVHRRRLAMWTRVAVVVGTSAMTAAIVVFVDTGEGAMAALGIVAWLSAIPFLWAGPPRIVDPEMPMTFTSQTHELVRVGGQVQPTLLTRDGPTTTGTIGRGGAVALTAVGLALYIAGVVLLVMDR